MSAAVTRRHRELAAKHVSEYYQREDAELRSWIATGDEEAGAWWICDTSVAKVAQALADIEAEALATQAAESAGKKASEPEAQRSTNAELIATALEAHEKLGLAVMFIVDPQPLMKEEGHAWTALGTALSELERRLAK